jgi:glutaredoxin-like protein NrdH
MERAGIPHTVVNLPDDAIALEYVRSLGYRQAPVVVAGAEHWSGFRPDRIASLSNAQLAA